jgi:hypothetical protein
MIPLLVFLAAAVLIAAPFVGMHDISPLDLFRGTLSDAAERIFLADTSSSGAAGLDCRGDRSRFAACYFRRFSETRWLRPIFWG